MRARGLSRCTGTGIARYASSPHPHPAPILTSTLQAPEVVNQYALDVSPTQLRHAIRMRFERNRNVTELRVIDVLLLKSRQEYQETLNMWKQPDHIYGILLQPKDRPSRTFLQKFYEGACVLS